MCTIVSVFRYLKKTIAFGLIIVTWAAYSIVKERKVNVISNKLARNEGTLYLKKNARILTRILVPPCIPGKRE